MRMIGLLLLASLGGCASVSLPPASAVSDQELRQSIAVLASDEFEGRFPGTEGERLTTAYLAERFRAAGLASAARGPMPYLDPVPLLRVERGEDRITLTAEDGARLALPRDQAFASTRADRMAIADAPLVFVGYGVDGSGDLLPDMAGKAVIMLGDPPPFLGDDQADRRQSSRREYDLLKAGAAAVLGLYAGPADRQAAAIAAGRRTQATRRMLRWAGDDGRWEVRGGIASEPLAKLLAARNIDLAALVQEARQPAFRPRILPWRIGIDQVNRVTPLTSHNVIGRLPGRRPDGRIVLLTAHWDHLGLCGPEGAADRICNGAVDNASGLAAMLAVAERLARSRPDRDVWFVATTAEEQTLQGANALVGNPPFRLDDVIAGFNLDTIAIGTRGAAVSAVAAPGSPLVSLVRQAATSQGKTFVAPGDAQSFISRQDGWAFVQRGIPMVFAGSSFTDPARLAAYLRSPYHGPDDELTDVLDLSGAAADADLHLELIRRAASRDYRGG